MVLNNYTILSVSSRKKVVKHRGKCCLTKFDFEIKPAEATWWSNIWAVKCVVLSAFETSPLIASECVNAQLLIERKILMRHG